MVFSKTRSNIKEILECSNATPIRCNVGTGYSCSFCFQVYPDPADLKKHTLSEHCNTFGFMNKMMVTKVVGKQLNKLCIKLDITGLNCKLCKCQMKDLQGLLQHLHRDHNRLIHEDVNNHIVPFKFDTEELSCCKCSKEFRSFKALLEHMNTHSTNYTCEECLATSINYGTLYQHKKSHVTVKYPCMFCAKMLNSKRNKLDHEWRCHKFVEKNTTGESYVCTICVKNFSNRFGLKVHMRRVHLKEKRFACEFCDRKFYALVGLKGHIITHTGEKNYQCDHCKKTFGVKDALREHMKVHNNDRRFKCEYCENSFIQKCKWRVHMRTKHGVEV